MDSQLKFWQIPEGLIIRNTCKEVEENLEVKGAKRIFFEELKNLIDLAFLVTHGKYGDDGCLQGLLELLDIPYTGSRVLSAALGMDKVMQRELMKIDKEINVPDYLVVSKKEWLQDKNKVREKIEKTFDWPVVTKPTRESSTIGVMLVKQASDLEKTMDYALAYDHKYLPGASKKITPIKINKKIIKEIQEQARRTYLALGCRGYARIDGFVDERGGF